MLGTKLLSKMIAEFHKLYPEIRVRFVEDSAANLQKALMQGDLDLVLIPYPIDKDVFEFFPFLKGDFQSSFNEMDHQHLKLKMLPLIEPQINWHLGKAWRKDSYLSYATRTWIEFLKKALER